MYITPAGMLEKIGAVELAQVTAQAGQAPTNPQTLEAVLRGLDTAGFEPAELEKAEKSAARIKESIDDASALIDGYLRQRGYKLPFAGVPRILTAWTRAIARYYLHQHLIAEESKTPIVRDYRDALALLEQVANGKFSLGKEDSIAEQGGGGPKYKAPPRIFSHQTLRDY